MKKLYMKEIATQLGIKMDSHDNFLIKKVATNPKQISNNTLLILLNKRRNIDWNKYHSYHSVAIITPFPIQTPTNLTVYQVDNVRNVYWKFIHYYRSLFDIPIIGITGTCGKTTTKEMLAWILEKDCKLHKTSRNRNKPARSFKYLLGIDDQTQAAIFEMPVSYPGSLRHCCKIFQPEIGIITTIGIDHLDRCKSIKNYIKEKQSLIEGMGFNGILIINADDENIKNIHLDSFKGKIINFGCEERADFRAKDIQQIESTIKFTLQYQENEFSFLIPGHGNHCVYNALAAIAAAHAIGFSIEDAKNRLVTFCYPQYRLQKHNGINGSILLDDTYSMNVTSIKSALDVLKSFPSKNRKIAVIGNLIRVGKAKEEINKLVGNLVANAKIDLLITVGNEASGIGKQAIFSGMKKNQVLQCNCSLEAYNRIYPILDCDTIILVKSPSDYYDLIERIKLS